MSAPYSPDMNLDEYLAHTTAQYQAQRRATEAFAERLSLGLAEATDGALSLPGYALEALARNLLFGDEVTSTLAVPGLFETVRDGGLDS